MPAPTFVLKEPTAKEKTLVYMIFRYHNQRFKYSTGLKIYPRLWNPESQRARETKEFKGASEFNTSLKGLGGDVENIYRKLVNDNILPTKERLRMELNKLSVKSEIVKKNDLIGFIEELIKSSNKRPNTIKNYKQTLKKLTEFKLYSKRELIFEHIDLNFYDEFLRFCLDKNYGANTIGGYIKNIKVFINEAFDRKLTTNVEFKNRRFKTIDEETESIYLTKEEIDLLYNHDLSYNKRLDRVRDMFIIACYTGLRYSDLIQINEKNLIDSRTKLKVKTEKTGDIVIIPLHRYIRNILKKYDGILEHTISNQKMNEYLKELGALAKIDEKVLISSTKGGRKQSESFKKYELISVHTARRSFATNAYLMDIPSISIMKITGHRTERAFLKYIKISQADNANKLLNHKFFK